MAFKPILYFVVGLAFIWGLLALHVSGHVIAFLKLLLALPVWGYVVVIAADIAMAWTAQPSDYQQSFYRTLRGELGGALGTGLVIASIYILSKAPYEASSFEIVAAAVPFAVSTIATIFSITRAKVANKPMKRAYGVLLLIVMLLCYGSIFSIALKVASNTYGIWASTWLQLTILFVALASYVETRRMLFVLRTGRMELSPFLLSFFGPDGPYGQLQAVAEQWNLHVAKQQKVAVMAARTHAESKSKAKKRRAKNRGR